MDLQALQAQLPFWKTLVGKKLVKLMQAEYHQLVFFFADPSAKEQAHAQQHFQKHPQGLYPITKVLAHMKAPMPELILSNQIFKEHRPKLRLQAFMQSHFQNLSVQWVHMWPGDRWLIMGFQSSEAQQEGVLPSQALKDPIFLLHQWSEKIKDNTSWTGQNLDQQLTSTQKQQHQAWQRQFAQVNQPIIWIRLYSRIPNIFFTQGLVIKDVLYRRKPKKEGAFTREMSGYFLHLPPIKESIQQSRLPAQEACLFTQGVGVETLNPLKTEHVFSDNDPKGLAKKALVTVQDSQTRGESDHRITEDFISRFPKNSGLCFKEYFFDQWEQISPEEKNRYWSSTQRLVIQGWINTLEKIKTKIKGEEKQQALLADQKAQQQKQIHQLQWEGKSAQDFQKLNTLFGQYKKLQRAQNQIQQRIEQQKQSLASGEKLFQVLDSWPDQCQDLGQWKKKIKAWSQTLPPFPKQKLVLSSMAKPSSGKVLGEKSFKIHYFQQLAYVVGKNAQQSHQIFRQWAKPWFLWMHAQGTPGPSVFLALSKNKVPTQEQLLMGAHLAQQHRLKGNSGENYHFSVHYALVKHIKMDRKTGQFIIGQDKIFNFDWQTLFWEQWVNSSPLTQA